MGESDLIRCRTSPLHLVAEGLSSFYSNNCPLLSQLSGIPLKGALTLGARGTFPAFFADAGERLSRHHTGTSILTRVWKTT